MSNSRSILRRSWTNAPVRVIQEPRGASWRLSGVSSFWSTVKSILRHVQESPEYSWGCMKSKTRKTSSGGKTRSGLKSMPLSGRWACRRLSIARRRRIWASGWVSSSKRSTSSRAPRQVFEKPEYSCGCSDSKTWEISSGPRSASGLDSIAMAAELRCETCLGIPVRWNPHQPGYAADLENMVNSTLQEEIHMQQGWLS